MRDPGELLTDWELTKDGEPVHGRAALLLPVRTAAGRPAALRVTDDRDTLDHLALRHWNGNGAVNLLRADPHRGALLLERLEQVDLTTVWDLTACEVVGELYGRLHIPAPPQLRRLPEVVGAAADLLRAPQCPLPRRMVEHALALIDSLADDSGSVGTLIHTDLHHANVLSAGDDQWVAISPKPLNGDPHYEVGAALIAHWDEVVDDVRFGVRRRFDTLIDVASLDEERAKAWVVVRMALLAASPGGDRQLLTRCVAVIKAMEG